MAALISAVEYRKQLENTVNENGGEYRGNLTKDITHLVAKEPAGKKYEFARQCGIRVVSLEWLEQSAERGMVLEETLFNPMLPPHQRGEDAWIRRTASTISLGKRSREDVPSLASRKLRRTASARLDNVGSGVWGDIVGAGVKQEKDIGQQPGDESSNEKGQLVKKRQDIAGQPTRAASPASSDGVFGNRHFVIYGFGEKQTAVLQKHLVSHGADMLESAAQFRMGEANTLIVPHQASHDSIPPLPGNIPKIDVVTEFWVEKCLFGRRFVDPGSSITHLPFPTASIDGFEKLAISSTAFQDIELSHTAKIVRLMGAVYSEDFTPKSSVLICATVLPSSTKRQLAKQWNVPTVNADWLWDCIRQGVLLPFEPYLSQAWPTGRADLVHQTLEHNTEVPQICQSDGNPRTRPHSDQQLDRRKKGISLDALKTAPKTPSSLSRTESIPLREITPNSSPPKPTSSASAEKRPTTSSKSIEALAPAISSLLAHHQALRSRDPPSEAPPKPRQRRKLLGRAPSNLSARSTGAMSHASSVDTLNTDGVGTPLSDTFAKSNDSVTRKALAKSEAYKGKHAYVDPDDEQGAVPAELPPGTQLGYEDPEIVAWRERVIKKLGGGADEEGGGAGRKTSRVEGTIKDTTFAGSGVAARTRAAVSGR